MKANRIAHFGTPDAIAFEDTAIPMPGEGEVLVRVSAAGVGPWDALVRSGKSLLAQALPLTLGADLAGSIEALGAGVSDFAPGDEVFGSTNATFTGAYAEYAVASSRMIAKKPQGLSWVEGAAVPVVAVTAWQMLERAGVGPKQTMLVHGAAGSVGSFVVQLAHRRGARVVATIASGDDDYVRSLGADEVVDVRTAIFEERTEPVDAVLDLVGGETQARSFAVLKPGGTIISVVSVPDAALARQKDVRSDFFYVDVNTTDLSTLGRMLDAGELKARVGTVLSLAEAREAHEMLDGSRHHDPGKIVLRVIGGWKR